MRFLPCLLVLAACVGSLFAADTLTLKSGGKLEGTVIQQSDQAVVLKMSSGTMTFPRDRIASIEHRDDPPPAPTPLPADIAADRQLLSWDAVVTALAKQPWASGLRQIPATVIDVGVMRAVPYNSYRCGFNGSIEVNVYGDPMSPICLELGVYGPTASDPSVLRQLVEFAATTFVNDPLNQTIVRGLDRNQDTATRRGLTMEITPMDAPDAYGAWWVAVYFSEQVDKARATSAEIETISVTRADATSRSGDSPTDWQADDIRLARVAPSPSPPSSSSGITSGGGSSRASSSGSSGGGGRVYVKGYYRKNGTYVSGHSRRR